MLCNPRESQGPADLQSASDHYFPFGDWPLNIRRIHLQEKGRGMPGTDY